MYGSRSNQLEFTRLARVLILNYIQTSKNTSVEDQIRHHVEFGLSHLLVFAQRSHCLQVLLWY